MKRMVMQGAPTLPGPGRLNLKISGLQRSVDRLRCVDVFLANIVGELLPNGLHGFDPCSALLGVQFAHNTTGVDDSLTGLCVNFANSGVTLNRDLS